MIAVVVAALAQAASPVFAPPLDRPIAVIVSEERTDGAGTRRFAIERRVTFGRRDGGFFADIDTVRVDGAANSPTGRMFEAAAAAMIGRRVRILLDAGGAVVDVEDRAGVWAAQVTGLEAMLAGRSTDARSRVVNGLLAPLRAMPPAQQIGRIGDMVAPLVAVDVVAAGAHAARAIELPARSLGGTPTMARGTETVTREAVGLLRVERVSETATLKRRSVRRVDTATGMAIENVETIEELNADTPQTIVRSTLVSL